MKKHILRTTMFVLLSSTALFAGADAGIEQEVKSSDRVQLSAGESTLERDGKFVRFNWKQTSGRSVRLSNKRSVEPSFIAPDVDEATVLKFRLTTKEKFKNRKGKTRKFKSRDYVEVIVFPEEELPTPTEPTEENPSLIIHKGITYASLSSPITGRIWLDRNLGARKVCSDVNNVSCFGDLYQWGREADGHEKRTSLVRQIGAININSISAEFVTSTEDGSYFYVGDWAFGDSNGSLRSQNWSKIDGSSVCPIDYRVPTGDELFTELRDENDKDFFKLANAGFRDDIFGRLISGKAHLWSSDASGSVDAAFSFYISRSKYFASAIHKNEPRTSGHSIRCIKD